jgi:hypothetical protein
MSVDLETVELRSYAELPDRHRGARVLAGTVDARGRALWLLTDPQQDPADRPSARFDAVVAVVDGESEWEVPLTGVHPGARMLDALPDGGFLTVAPAAEPTRSGPAAPANTQVFGPDGTRRADFRIGDGVAFALTDRQGTLWTGYSDEGIFSDPLSAPGLARWSARGERLWAFTPVSGADYIADCYTLNVSEDVVWASTYTGFPLLEIRDQRVYRVRSSPVAGPSGVVVHRDRAVFFGGYGETAGDRLTFCRLGLDSVDEEGQLTLLRPGGERLREGGERPVGASVPAVCRGERLYVADPRTHSWGVYQVSW